MTTTKFPRRPIIVTDDVDMPPEPADPSIAARIIDIADVVLARLLICRCTVEVLKAIDRKYPALAFGEFLTAVRLVELATREPRGRA